MMTRAEFLNSLEEILERPKGSLQGPERLEDLEMWDSTAMISFIALADSNNGTRLAAREIAGCQTVDDLVRLAKAGGA